MVSLHNSYSLNRAGILRVICDLLVDKSGETVLGTCGSGVSIGGSTCTSDGKFTGDIAIGDDTIFWRHDGSINLFTWVTFRLFSTPLESTITPFLCFALTIISSGLNDVSNFFSRCCLTSTLSTGMTLLYVLYVTPCFFHSLCLSLSSLHLDLELHNHLYKNHLNEEFLYASSSQTTVLQGFFLQQSAAMNNFDSLQKGSILSFWLRTLTVLFYGDEPGSRAYR